MSTMPSFPKEGPKRIFLLAFAYGMAVAIGVTVGSLPHPFDLVIIALGVGFLGGHLIGGQSTGQSNTSDTSDNLPSQHR